MQAEPIMKMEVLPEKLNDFELGLRHAGEK
jgi:hypothetical protein